jgi:hypothetical protein
MGMKWLRKKEAGTGKEIFLFDFDCLGHSLESNSPFLSSLPKI